MRLASHLGFCVLCSVFATASVPVLAQPGAAKQGIFTCVDSAGRRITADRPIPQCADREQRVLSPTGVERARLGPVLSEAEMSQRLELRRKEQLGQQRLQEQRRRDAALLARYPDQSRHDVARREALQPISERQDTVQQRMQALDKEKQALDQELQFYQQDPAKAPARLRATAQDIEKAQQEQQALLDAHADEAKRIHQRFDTELRRLQPLWQSQRPAPVAADQGVSG